MNQARLFFGAIALAVMGTAHAQFTESWESPPVVAGSTTSILPVGWTLFSGTGMNKIEFSNTTAEFNSVMPLSSPAEGSQFLSLSGANTGVARASGLFIQPNTGYQLNAAIGNSKLVSDDTHWSLQLWADTNSTNAFEGSVTNGDTFIGQQYGTSMTAIAGANGEWGMNSFSFNSATTPGLIGKQLIVFLNNFSGGKSYYDVVTVSAVPEPSSAILFIVGALGIAGLVRGKFKQ